MVVFGGGCADPSIHPSGRPRRRRRPGLASAPGRRHRGPRRWWAGHPAEPWTGWHLDLAIGWGERLRWHQQVTARPPGHSERAVVALVRFRLPGYVGRGRCVARDGVLSRSWLVRVASGSDGTVSMDVARRRELADRLLEDYVHGPAAATEATARALEEMGSAEAVVLVEGVSDQIAVETLARRRGRDLSAEGVAVLPIGGAHAIRRYLTRFGPAGAGLRLAGLCDAAEENVFRRGLAGAGIGLLGTRADMERLGFYVCTDDLEDELIRAIGTTRVEAVIDSQGDLGSFRSLQRQPGWRDQPARPQLRRFVGSGGRRKLRYARLLAAAVDLDRLPSPLDGILSAV